MIITFFICIAICVCIFFICDTLKTIHSNEIKNDIKYNEVINSLDKIRYLLNQINKEYVVESTYKYVDDALCIINNIIRDDKPTNTTKTES